MIYTTNWIERLQKDFRRVTRMRGALPDESLGLVLMGRTEMDKESYHRVISRIGRTRRSSTMRTDEWRAGIPKRGRSPCRTEKMM